MSTPKMNFADQLKSTFLRPQIPTITVKSTNKPTTTPPTNNESSSTTTTATPTLEVASSNSSFPLPRVNDPSFKEKWKNRYLSNNCGITLDPVHGAKQIDYLDAIDKIVSAEFIVSIGKNTDGRYVVFFTSQNYADSIIENGIEILGTYVAALPVTIRPIRVLVSCISPNIPDIEIINFLKTYGKVTSGLRPVPINANENAKYRHILSTRREVYIQLNANTVLPPRVKIIYEDVTSYFTLDTEVNCYKCKKSGHIASNCDMEFPAIAAKKTIADRLIVCSNCNLNGHISDNCPGAIKKTPTRSYLTNVDDIFSSENRNNLKEKINEEQVNPPPKRSKIDNNPTVNLITIRPELITAPPQVDEVTPMEDDDTVSVTSETSSTMSIEMEENLDFDLTSDVKTSLPIATLVQCLQQLNYKKTVGAIKKVIIQYTTNFKPLPDDFRTLKEHIRNTSSNPTTTIQRIDRLLPKLVILSNQKK